jgi:hypothetical protein
LPLTITPDDTLRRWTYNFLCLLQGRVFTHTVLSLCVHPAMMQVNGCFMTVNPFTVKVCCPRLRFPNTWTTFLWRRRLLAFANVLPQRSHS